MYLNMLIGLKLMNKFEYVIKVDRDFDFTLKMTNNTTYGHAFTNKKPGTKPGLGTR